MRILFASSHPYLPQLAGGSQTNTHEMAQALIARGHRVAVLAGLMPGNGVGRWVRPWLKLSGRRTVLDGRLGYPVYRGWHAWEGAAEAASRFRPDIAIAQSGAILRVAGALRAAGMPIIIYNHNIEFDDHGADMEAFRDCAFIANSAFTASAYRERYGIESTIVPPLFDRARYVVESARREVLFVNPHPLKGIDIALGLARACPDIPFRFVRGWLLSAREEAHLAEGIAGLPNIRVFPQTDVMATHYAEARILLAPSRWAETWGRVATEAQFSGIPVLAGAIGGLPEAVGPGGVLVGPDAPLSEWVGALRRMWDDRTWYDRLATAARTHADRPQIDPDRQLERIEELAGRVSRFCPDPAVGMATCSQAG